jgi:hypothetical protein
MKNWNEKVIRMNLKRTIEYLEEKERFDKGRLCGVDEIINLNINAIWGILIGVYKYYKGCRRV